jgi:NAD(P)-dependent dehydrogenase (short-subunit alcohol dehydrogenase family)
VAGASVIMSDVDLVACESAAQRLREAGHQATSTELDVRDAAAFCAAFDAAWTQHGRIDLLFNNAGIGAAAQTGDMTDELWRRVVEINLLGVVHGVHAAWPRMAAAGGGQS